MDVFQFMQIVGFALAFFVAGYSKKITAQATKRL